MPQWLELGSHPSSAVSAPCDLRQVTKLTSRGVWGGGKRSFTGSALRTEPGTRQSQTGSTRLSHSLVHCLGSRWPTNHRMPASALPWTHLLPERARQKASGSSLAQPQHRPPRDTQTSPPPRGSHAVSSLHTLAPARPSTWSALPRFPDPTQGRMGSPACSPRASPGAPLALRHALSPTCSTDAGLARRPCWVPSAQPRAPPASLSNK